MPIQSRWLILLGGSVALVLAGLRRAIRRGGRRVGKRADTVATVSVPTAMSVPVPPPCRRERERILAELVLDCLADSDLDLPLLARLTSGYDPAGLERLVTRTCESAEAAGRAPTMSDAALALEHLASQDGSLSRLLEPEERQRAANLAAGHVMVAWPLGLLDPNMEVSILSTDLAWPVVGLASRDLALDTRQRGAQQVAMLDMLLAGPIAHELLDEGRVRAPDTTLLRAIVLATSILGGGGARSEVGFGPTNHSPRQLATDTASQMVVAGALATTLERDVDSLLQERSHVVRERLIAVLPQLHDLASLLVEEETVSVRALLALLDSEAS